MTINLVLSSQQGPSKRGKAGSFVAKRVSSRDGVTRVERMRYESRQGCKEGAVKLGVERARSEGRGVDDRL